MPYPLHRPTVLTFLILYEYNEVIVVSVKPGGL